MAVMFSVLALLEFNRLGLYLVRYSPSFFFFPMLKSLNPTP
jgi:hypothetical protein